mmetsp:Transcript_24477/g.35800  ORF Transcript_24477/g.35800 Transcript_24477/m.35800 type:complete len:303 (-) Transcript_24477:319-1227(-)
MKIGKEILHSASFGISTQPPLQGNGHYQPFFSTLDKESSSSTLCSQALSPLHLLRKNTNLANKFEIADILLRAAHYGMHPKDDNDASSSCDSRTGFIANDKPYWSILHAIANIGCHVHPSLWKLALRLFPEKAKQRDQRGMLPLHYAVSCTACSTLEKVSATDIIVDQLLDLYPFGSRCADNEGRIPLNIALDNHCHAFSWDAITDGENVAEEANGGCNRTGVIPRLLASAPEALHTRDSKTKMYPFMLAAVSNGDDKYKVSGNRQPEEITSEDIIKTTIVFELLKMSPERIQDALIFPTAP